MRLVWLLCSWSGWAADPVPAPIAATVAREWPNAQILEVEDEGGAVEVELQDGAARVDVLFRADGTWIEVKVAVAASELPKAVLAAASREGRVTEAERRSTPDGRADWEIEVRDRQGSRVLHLDDAGRILRSRVEDDEEDDGEN